MEKLLSNGTKHETVPECYIIPLGKRPELLVNTCKGVPIIRLAEENRNQMEVSNQIIDPGKEFGFFQVVDHGVPKEVIGDLEQVAEEFFDMPMEDKALYYSEDFTKFPRLCTSQGSNVQEMRYWRDCLRLVCKPGDEFVHLYPEKPIRFRNAVAKFVAEAENLATRILKLISVGLGFDDDYFNGNLSKGPIRMNINHYPPCPDPSKTLGLPKHCDPNLITLLLQGNVSGLQVMHGGEWVPVDPIPDAIIVNFGHAFEVVTNGLLKSVEHRAVTNATDPRTSIATFIVPTEDCIIAPEKSLVSEYSQRPFYKSLSYSEFFGIYLANQGDREITMQAVVNKN